MSKRYFIYMVVILGTIVLDQVVKLAVYWYVPLGPLGEIKLLGDWFKIYHVMNPGMGFGIEIGSQYGKLWLMIFRFMTVGILVKYLIHLLKNPKNHALLLWSMALILGGAIGNVIDSVFYGVYLHNAPPDAPMVWLYGQVIDMFYIDIWNGVVPASVPLLGGKHITLWPIFNIADSAITIGLGLLFIHQHWFQPTASTIKKS